MPPVCDRRRGPRRGLDGRTGVTAIAAVLAYAESADSLFGVALWLPALYFAFGVVAATLAELLVAARPSSATKSGSSSPE
jgi:hypothetical protein